METLRTCDRRARCRRVVALLAGLGLVTAACSNNVSTETTSTVAETTSTVEATTNPAATATEPVTVVEDLIYLSTEPAPWKLDVYYSPASVGGPVVVFFHGGGVDKGFSIYGPIAKAIADGGGVVFMPDWDDTLPDDAAGFAAGFDAAACAVSYALAHAFEYEADPNRLVLAGHSAGASVPPAAGGLRQASPVAGCAVAMGATEVAGMVLWDGDWLMGGHGWDRYDTHLPGIMDAVFPWAMLENDPKVPVVLATSSRSPDQLKRCGVDNPEDSYWVRDPDGWFRDQLEQSGMLDDGCIDNGEGEDLLAKTMSTHRFDATRLILEDSGHIGLSERGRAQLVEAILTIGDQ